MPIKLLYVDDDKDIGSLVELSLEMDGKFKVHNVQSGQEALRIAQDFKPDLALLDVMMPEMDGPETFTRLKALPGLEDLPIIFITARSLKTELEALLGMGAIGTIPKPFDPLEIGEDIIYLYQRDLKQKRTARNH